VKHFTRRRIVIVSTAIIFVLAIPTQLPAQEADSEKVAANLNEHYRFPISAGIEYQSLTPFASYNTDYNIIDISGEVRYPIPSIPVLQPLFHAGVVRFDSLDPAFPEKWDHMHIYGNLGIAYVNRFVKNFEFGGQLQAGFSEAIFPNAVDTATVSSANLLFVAGGKISLIPSYNLGIEFHPSVRYLLSLSPLKTFNGFLFGIGISAHFRFGEDPDSARALMRSIRFDQVSVPSLFSAMQSYYVKNPIGTATITNTERMPLTEVEVSFFQKSFMDTATISASIPELPPGESRDVPLLASFNEEVFTTEGVTPLTGEVIVTYRLRGRPAEQRQPVSYDLHDKTAIIWDDDRKVGAFITPADSALRNYTSYIRQALKDQTAPRFNEPVQLAMQIYSALTEIGTLYQVDPTSPFTEVQENTLLVDSVSLPRDTLKRITGDCDDLTVLFCSLLETVGIETGFITVPGHIYPVVNTGVETREYRQLHPDRTMTISIDGELWLPIEITMLGSQNFMEAWIRGAELWQAFENDAVNRGFYRTRESQVVFRPVGLRETDLGLQYGSAEAIARGFERDLNRLSDIIVDEFAVTARSKNDPRAYNRLVMAYVDFARYEDAEWAFNRAIQLNSGYLSAQVNLGNVKFMQKSYYQALRIYEDAHNTLVSRGRGESQATQMLLINISLVHHALENYQEAKQWYTQAEEMDPERARGYAFLGRTGSGGERAADMASGMEVFFLDEESP
jgi:hypothetical protein